MKSFFKRSAITIAILGIAGASYAKSSGYYLTGLTGAFIGVEGLDLRPMNGDLDYVTLVPNSPDTTFNTQAINPSYNWNWRIYGGIKFTDSDDITLSWMQMRTSESDSVSPTGSPPPNGIGGSFPRWLVLPGFITTYAWSTISSHVTFDLDDAYAVWGHTIKFNNPWTVRFAAGLEYAKLDSDLRVTTLNNTLPSPPIFFGNTTFGYTADSHTKSFGPRLEFDAKYSLPYGFALFEEGNMALFNSTRKVSLIPYTPGFSIETFVVSNFLFYNSSFTTRHVIIPKFGTRLGASYSYTWGQAGAEGCGATTLTVDAGWEIEAYIHAIERPEQGFASRADGTPTPPIPSFSNFDFATTKVSNFSNQGLFVGIKLGMDWA